MQNGQITFIDYSDPELLFDSKSPLIPYDIIQGIEYESNDFVRSLEHHHYQKDDDLQRAFNEQFAQHSIQKEYAVSLRSQLNVFQNFSGQGDIHEDCSPENVSPEQFLPNVVGDENHPRSSKSLDLNQKKVNPGDIRKNGYGNIIKQTIKSYVYPSFSKKVQWIHRRLGILDSQKAKNVFKRWKSLNICFGDAYYLLKDRTGTNEERLAKKAFSVFFQWYNRSHYSPYVIHQKKIAHTAEYIKVKNLLLQISAEKLTLIENGERFIPVKSEQKISSLHTLSSLEPQMLNFKC